MTKFFVLAIAAVMAGCNGSSTESTTTTDADTVSSASSATDKPAVVPAMQCYQRVTARDTLFLQINAKGDKVTGTLFYKNFEKDSNRGTIRGTMMGDTLLADFSFQSEGMNNVREVIFLYDGNTFTEGYGDMKNENDKFVFTNRAKIDFSKSGKLQPAPCPPQH